MPTIGVRQDDLFASLGKSFTDKEMDELCFDFGLELDDVEEVQDDDGSKHTEYRVEIPANRYDLLCVEGLARALQVYRGTAPLKRYTALRPSCPQSLQVQPATAQIRPHAVMAVLRDVTFNAHNYKSFIDLQDKLHQNICRQRSLVAIGTHDLDTLQGPFVYDARPPADIKFRALGQEKEMTAVELMELYSKESHLKAYLPIIRDSPVYPVILDSNGVVLSMPPIINGNHSRITLQTRNVLIECTATDLTKARIVLDTICCMFSQYCAQPYVIETAEVVTPQGTVLQYPSLPYRTEEVSVDLINRSIGISESPERIAELLTHMCLESQVLPGKEAKVKVTVPPTRADVLHACDIIEDVAISHGYNNIVKTIPQAMTVGSQQMVNKVTDLLRGEVAASGYTEVLTFALCSRDDVSTKLGHKLETIPAVHIGNPKTVEFQVGRTSLLPGILKTAYRNKNMPLPLNLFEIQDVILKDATSDTGSRNRRDLCALHVSRTSGFELVHGLLDRLMQLLDIAPADVTSDVTGDKKTYIIREASDPTFFPGRCAEVVVSGQVVGVFGVLHPDVLTAFGLTDPSSALSLQLQDLL